VRAVKNTLRMGESAVVRMKENGMVIVPVEVREVLGVDGEEVYLRLNDIEVAKKSEDTDE
jgi:bifunctional DNA-binding transcriptional regulator/antitoxin component of YhaV-PrlF toxin-antitoxin module